jgi:hypothetical protein
MAHWEAGDLPLIEVAARHPEAGVHGLADLHARLSLLLEEDSILETAGVWVEIRSRLHAPPSPLRARLRRRVVHPVVAAAAAVLLIGGIAYASGVEPVREGVDRVVRVVTGMFDDDRKGIQAPGDSGPNENRREERSRPGRDGDQGDDRNVSEDRSGPGGGTDADDNESRDDEDRSGPGDGDDGDDEPEHEGPGDDLSSDSGSNSGSGSDDHSDEEPVEKIESSEGSHEADD